VGRRSSWENTAQYQIIFEGKGKKNANRVVVGKPEENRRLGRPRHKW
jgi:hypothetical protein